MKEYLKEKSIFAFTESFVCIGPRENVIGLYDLFLKKGVVVPNSSRVFRTTRKKCILICNQVKESRATYPYMTLVNRSWYDEWYKKSKHISVALPKQYDLLKTYLDTTSVEYADFEPVIPK